MHKEVHAGSLMTDQSRHVSSEGALRWWATGSVVVVQSGACAFWATEVEWVDGVEEA